MGKIFVSALSALLGLVAAPAWAQGIGLGFGGGGSDVSKDVNEVEEVVDEEEYLPFEGDEADEGADDIRAAQTRELELSLEELRSRHDYAMSVALGPTKPWQTYSFEVQSLLEDDLALGAYAGFADKTDAGIIDEQAYDLRLKARSFGFSLRWFMTRLERLSFELDLGYGSWEATVTPHGADDSDVGESDLLSAGFRGHGPIAGIGANLSWIFDNGVFLEWLPFGARFSKALQRDFTRETALGKRAILRNLERPAFYGLTNIRLGWYF